MVRKQELHKQYLKSTPTLINLQYHTCGEGIPTENQHSLMNRGSGWDHILPLCPKSRAPATMEA
eukprot:5623354-Karenia_brevis.AAC.1